ncbi:hypothetical protein [Gottfriedia luciferensis]|uniref:hypothetical protein n=1 Tax=Gottfriedia luciferensis TaxID=178774 RepID=UPI00130270BF|nr:hypothetical protein [Gottfriedia luciferensis]
MGQGAAIKKVKSEINHKFAANVWVSANVVWVASQINVDTVQIKNAGVQIII